MSQVIDPSVVRQWVKYRAIRASWHSAELRRAARRPEPARARRAIRDNPPGMAGDPRRSTAAPLLSKPRPPRPAGRPFRLLRGGVAVLPGIRCHVKQRTAGVQAILLRPHAHLPVLVGEEHPVGPLHDPAGGRQQRCEVLAVQRPVSLQRHTGHLGQGGQQINGPGDAVHPSTRRDAAWPADQAGHSQAALVGRALAALHTPVPPPRIRAVVREIDHDRVQQSLPCSSVRIADTIVVYFSDNGPNTWRWNGGMKGRKGSTDEGGLRVPCLIRWPGRISPWYSGGPHRRGR